MNCNKSMLGIFLAIVVLLPGCMLHVPTYRRQPFSVVSGDFMYNETIGNLNVCVKRLSPADKHYLFDSRSEVLQYNRVRAIYISIHNLSNVGYIFSPDDIGLQQISYVEINKTMKKTSTVGRLTVAGLGAASFAMASQFKKDLNNPNIGAPGYAACALMIPFAIIGYILVPVGLVQSIRSIIMNKRISRDLKEKTFHETVTIESGGQYDGLIFVKSIDYHSQFTVILHEEDAVNQIVTFDVNL